MTSEGLFMRHGSNNTENLALASQEYINFSNILK